VEFITLAEETGLIGPIGEWVLAESCRQLSEWDRTTGTRRLGLNVNVSANQLRDESLIASVRRILRSTGIAPSRLTLEVTESVLLQDSAVAIERLDALRGLGVRIAIDDFGTGYSSLSYLQRLPVDSVKIDSSFVRDVASAPRAAAFVRAILELCTTIGLTTIAEGIETQAQAEVIHRLGCTLAQGYFYARPLDPSQIGFSGASFVEPPRRARARSEPVLALN
jgi:diguanylate cyclase